jgi:hypothetical protein
MAKPEKKSGRKEKKSKTKKGAGAAVSPGLLVSLDGTSGELLRSEAARLARLCCGDADPAWSLWDASNTFYEMRLTKARNLTPTPATLMLLYASDLLFRLRWEIGPTLQEGRTVVAAPYVESAMAFGIAAGLSRDWLEQLFRFAPKPAASFRLKEKKKNKEKKAKESSALSGFVECCCACLAKNYPGWEIAEVRPAMLQYLKDLEEKDRIRAFGRRAYQIKRALT